MRITPYFSLVFPTQTPVSLREKALSALAAACAIALVIWASQQLAHSEHRPFVIASMGSSAVLLFAVFHGPLSQPWAVAGGHLLAAAIGVLCARYISDPVLAAAAALGLAMFVMHGLRCLHPPAGATAVFAVIGGQPIQALGWDYVFSVVGINVAVLLATALLINNLLPGRRFPVRRLAEAGMARPARAATRPEHEDILAALKSMDTFIDVAEEDLERIYVLATINRQKRNLGTARVRDIMTPAVVTVAPGTTLARTWETLRRHGIRGVPVVGDDDRLAGMVAISDFLKCTDWDWQRRGPLRCLLTSARRGRPSIASDIMTRPVIALREDAHAAELFSTFADNGINHVPVTDAAGRLVGIVTRLDLLALFRGGVDRQVAA